MKDTIKMAISHFFIITVCVTAAIGFSNLIAGNTEGYPQEFPLHLLLIGATSALPSLLFYFRKEPSRKQFLLRVVLHFLCIITIVMGEGYLLKWYGSFAEAAIIAGIVIAVYIAVWLITMHSNNKAEQGINEALKNFNNDEAEETDSV